jgi:hypothetical protein
MCNLPLVIDNRDIVPNIQSRERLDYVYDASLFLMQSYYTSISFVLIVCRISFFISPVWLDPCDQHSG